MLKWLALFLFTASLAHAQAVYGDYRGPAIDAEAALRTCAEGQSRAIVSGSPACAATSGATAFSAVTPGTNTAGALVIGTGSSLAPSGSGSISASQTATATPTQCLAGNVPRGIAQDFSAANCAPDDDVPEAGDYGSLGAGAGLDFLTPGNLRVRSDELNFLLPNAVTCGAGNGGKLRVASVASGAGAPLELCDQQATPATRYIADADSLGRALVALQLPSDGLTFPQMMNLTTQRIIGRNTAASGDPEEITVSQVLDWLGSAQGTVLYRGAGGWTALAPGTAGQFLESQGAAANVRWGNPLGSGDASTNTATSVDGEAAVFSGIGGKTLKRATGSGIGVLASGVLSATDPAGCGDSLWARDLNADGSIVCTQPAFGNIAGIIGVDQLPLASVALKADYDTLVEFNAQTADKDSAGFWTHATDCGLVTGNYSDFCLELDEDKLFFCEPSGGPAQLCDTAGEWKLPTVTAAQIATGAVTPAKVDLSGETWDYSGSALRYYNEVLAKAASGAIAPDEVKGMLLTNQGSGGAIILSLPDATTGMGVCIALTVANDVTINPADVDTLIVVGSGPLAAGDALSAAGAIGDMACFNAVSTSQWLATIVGGTWTDVN